MLKTTQRRHRTPTPPTALLARKAGRKQDIPADKKEGALARTLAREPMPTASSYGRLLAVILNNLTEMDGQLVFKGAVHAAATVAGVSQRQAVRCVQQYVERGILISASAPRGRPPGRPKVYRVNL